MPDSPPIRVLIADDHPIFRSGLKNLIDKQPDMRVVAEAADGDAAVRAYLEQRPDVTLMDLRMPGQQGADAIAAIVRGDPQARVIVLTTFDSDVDVHRATAAGARGYLRKDTFAEGILDAIRDVHLGGQIFGVEIPTTPSAGERESGPALSPRELSIIELVAQGLANKEIQVVLSMAEGTLKNHLKRIFDKLEVHDRTGAAMEAARRGLVRLT